MTFLVICHDKIQICHDNLNLSIDFWLAVTYLPRVNATHKYSGATRKTDDLTGRGWINLIVIDLLNQKKHLIIGIQ